MTEAISLFDPGFIKAVENIEFPTSIWRYLFTRIENVEGHIMEELKIFGFTETYVRSQLSTINQLETESLIQTFLADETAAEAACGALQIRTSKQDKERAFELIHSSAARERVLGMRMLTYKLGTAFESEVVAELHKLSAIEEDDEVLEALCYALHQLMDVDKVSYLKHLVNKANADVRYALSACCFGSTDPDAIEVLVSLCRDQDPKVRNWAVTGLAATVSSGDDVEEFANLKSVFIEQLADENRFTRLEAITALGQYKDKNRQALNILTVELTDEVVPLLAINAAMAFADPVLCAPLEKLYQIAEPDDPIRADIERAIVVCKH